MKAVIEGLLFISGAEGITVNDISKITELENEEVVKLLEELKNDYEDANRGIKLVYLGNHYKLTTKEEHKEYFKKLLENPKNNTLSFIPKLLTFSSIVDFSIPSPNNTKTLSFSFFCIS